MSGPRELLRARWAVPILAVVLAGAGIATSIPGVLFTPERFFQSYLVAYVFWLGLALGCVALLMIHYLIGGAWSRALAPVLESGAATMPLLALLFVPLLPGLPDLYPWARAEAVAAEPELQRRQAFLNVPFFVTRAALYLGAWVVIAYTLRAWGARAERTGDPRWTIRLRRLSAGGLVVLTLTVTFAVIDWVMSIETRWHSSIYPALVGMGALLGAFALVVPVTALRARGAAPATAALARIRGQLGGMLLAFAILWVYFAYSQLLIVWSGNLPDQAEWYLRRLDGWLWVGVAAAGGQFVMPLALLVSARLRRDARVLAIAGCVVLLAHALHVFWLIVPAFQHGDGSLHWLHFTTAGAIGGLWVALFASRLRDRAPVLT